MSEFNKNFIKPETINIFGSKEQENGSIAEADILFQDIFGTRWMITIQTANEFVRDALSDITPDDLSVEDLENSHQEIKKMLWNDELNSEMIYEILTEIPFNLIRPFITQLIDDL